MAYAMSTDIAPNSSSYGITESSSLYMSDDHTIYSYESSSPDLYDTTIWSNHTDVLCEYQGGITSDICKGRYCDSRVSMCQVPPKPSKFHYYIYIPVIWLVNSKKIFETSLHQICTLMMEHY